MIWWLDLQLARERISVYPTAGPPRCHDVLACTKATCRVGMCMMLADQAEAPGRTSSHSSSAASPLFQKNIFYITKHRHSLNKSCSHTFPCLCLCYSFCLQYHLLIHFFHSETNLLVCLLIVIEFFICQFIDCQLCPCIVLGAGNIVVNKADIWLLGERFNKQIEISIYLHVVITAKKKMTILGDKTAEWTDCRKRLGEASW